MFAKDYLIYLRPPPNSGCPRLDDEEASYSTCVIAECGAGSVTNLINILMNHFLGKRVGVLFAVLSACVLPACKTDLSDVWNSIVNISFEKYAQTASVAAKSSAEISGRTVADRTNARDSRSQMLLGFDIE